jgi:hypothetical protein
MKYLGKIVKIYRSIGEESSYGVVVAASRDLLLLNAIYEKIRYGKFEKAMELMFKKLRIRATQVPLSLDLTSMASAVNSLLKLNGNIIIEDEKREDFYIGQLLGCDGTVCRLRYLSAEWKWDRKESLIAIPRISKVQFAGNYEKTTTRYMSGK